MSRDFNDGRFYFLDFISDWVDVLVNGDVVLFNETFDRLGDSGPFRNLVDLMLSVDEDEDVDGFVSLFFVAKVSVH